jgi:biotin synthase-like enzyme
MSTLLSIKTGGCPEDCDSRTIERAMVMRATAMVRTNSIVSSGAASASAAGRETMSEEAQALCFLAGANSVFCGPKLLTTPNPERDRDLALMDRLGMQPMG